MRADTTKFTQLLGSLDRQIDDYAAQLKENGGDENLKKRLKTAQDRRDEVVDKLYGGASTTPAQNPAGTTKAKALID